MKYIKFLPPTDYPKNPPSMDVMNGEQAMKIQRLT